MPIPVVMINNWLGAVLLGFQIQWRLEFYFADGTFEVLPGQPFFQRFFADLISSLDSCQTTISSQLSVVLLPGTASRTVSERIGFPPFTTTVFDTLLARSSLSRIEFLRRQVLTSALPTGFPSPIRKVRHPRHPHKVVPQMP